MPVLTVGIAQVRDTITQEREGVRAEAWRIVPEFAVPMRAHDASSPHEPPNAAAVCLRCERKSPSPPPHGLSHSALGGGPGGTSSGRDDRGGAAQQIQERGVPAGALPLAGTDGRFGDFAADIDSARTRTPSRFIP